MTDDDGLALNAVDSRNCSTENGRSVAPLRWSCTCHPPLPHRNLRYFIRIETEAASRHALRCGVVRFIGLHRRLPSPKTVVAF